jgi:ABC-type Mn2+/Zn2+ transport system ATPase subunit
MKQHQVEIINHEPARLDLENIVVAYDGRPILDNVSLEVPHGAQVAVVGPNGAGKSTLFKALVGLLPLRKGQIYIHGLPLGQHKDCVAYIPQREEVDWRFPVTVEEVVMMGRFNHFGWLGKPSAADWVIVKQCMLQLGISKLARHSIGELSGGQQQRVFLARALAQEPHILLMDEPFTGVDLSTQEAILKLLDELRARGVTVLVSTHDLNMAAERFERILLIKRRIIAYGTRDQVFTHKNIGAAFGKQALIMDDLVVVDRCCPGDEHEHNHQEEAEE